MINEEFAALASKLPKDYKANAESLVQRMGEEIEGIGDEPQVWRPNYLRIVQATSDRSKLPKGTAIGALILGEDVAEQPLNVIPLRMWRARQFWDPDHDANRQICYSPDAVEGLLGKCRGCPHAKFNEELGKSDCGMVLNFLVAKADLSDIFYVQFAKTNYSNGKDWENTLKKAGVAPYRRVYSLETFTNASYKNVESMKASPVGETPKELNDLLFSMMRTFGEDRKAHIEDFRQMAAERREAGDLPHASLDAPTADKQLEHIPEETVTETEGSEGETSQAKGYRL